LPQPQPYLRPGLTVATLKRIAQTMSDTEAARRMQEAKHRLFTQCKTAQAANAYARFAAAVGLWK